MALAGDLHDIKRNYVRDRLVVHTENPGPILQDLGDYCRELPEGGLLIQLADPGEKQTMMRRLASGYDIDGVQVYEPSLNDIFVQYAGDTDREKEANQ